VVHLGAGTDSHFIMRRDFYLGATFWVWVA
jgi:hypothetical protein